MDKLTLELLELMKQNVSKNATYDVICSEAIKKFCHSDDQEANEVMARIIIKGLLSASGYEKTLHEWGKIV